MIYQNMKEGIFLERPNRFIAHVLLDGEVVVCHVKNTGRCRELLIPEKTVVYIQDHGENTTRKTRYSLIGVKKGELMINMDSQAPNKVVKEWLSKDGLIPGLTKIKPEQTYGDSRFDFYLERGDEKMFMEVKGVTLEENQIAMFPDAPTERGVKHIHELMKCIDDGYQAYIVFVIQMEGMKKLIPNDVTHKAFGDALREAKEKGVKIIAMECKVTDSELSITKPVLVEL